MHSPDPSLTAAQRPAPRTSLGDHVLADLRAQIASGVLAPGTHLREAEIAAAMAVSRGPVRDALTALANEGQVEIHRHRGAFVSVLTQRDVEEVHSLRTSIESLAAHRAATRLTPEIVVQLDAALEAMRTRTVLAPQEAVQLDLAFHDVIYRAADHQRLLRTWTSIRAQVAFFLHIRNVNFPDFGQVGYREHSEVRDALLSGDPELASRSVQHHLAGAYTRLQLLDLPPG